MVIASAASWVEISFHRCSLNKVHLINTVYVHPWNRCMLDNDALLMRQVCWKMPGENAHVTCQVTSTASVILSQRGVTLLHKWNGVRPDDFITASDACKCAVHNYKSCSTMVWDATPHHDTTSNEWSSLDHTTVMETFTNTTLHSRTTAAAVEMKPGLVREKNRYPVLLSEMYVRILVHSKYSGNVIMTYTMMPTARHLSVSFNLGMAYQRRFFPIYAGFVSYRY